MNSKVLVVYIRYQYNLIFWEWMNFHFSFRLMSVYIPLWRQQIFGTNVVSKKSTCMVSKFASFLLCLTDDFYFNLFVRTHRGLHHLPSLTYLPTNSMANVSFEAWKFKFWHFFFRNRSSKPDDGFRGNPC